MPHYKIKHVTHYSYPSTVIDCTNQIMLYPIIDALLEVRNHEIKITHDPTVDTFTDYFGNQTGVFSIIKPHSELFIESVADVITKPITFPEDQINPHEQWEILDRLKNHTAYMDFLQPEPLTNRTEIKEVLNALVDKEKTPLKNALSLSDYVYNNFTYQKGITSVTSKTEDVWRMKAGVCQDFAHILIIFLRTYGIPSRYVSGYIYDTDKEMRGQGATHAWVETFVPNFGWLGLDPTNNCMVNDHHIRLATGRSFADCTPVKGTYKGSGEHRLEVYVDIKNSSVKKSSEKQDLPKFSYQAKNPGEPINTYRYYEEIQRKQRLQQQQ